MDWNVYQDNAKNVYFVENENLHLEILKKNIEKLKLEKKTKIFFNDAFSIIKKKKYFSDQNLI